MASELEQMTDKELLNFIKTDPEAAQLIADVYQLRYFSEGYVHRHREMLIDWLTN